jgi:hypothetical protein
MTKGLSTMPLACKGAAHGAGILVAGLDPVGDEDDDVAHRTRALAASVSGKSLRGFFQ